MAAVWYGEAAVTVYNIWEIEKNVPYYVESSVTDVVRKVSGGRWSRERESPAIPEFRFTRVGGTTNSCPCWAAHGVVDIKVGRRGLAIDSPVSFPNYYLAAEKGSWEVEV